VSTIHDDLNPDWESPFDDQWEPWEPDEDVDVRECGCAYCGKPDVRDVPDPFGGKPCCDACFVTLIGDDGGPPWRCETTSASFSPPAGSPASSSGVPQAREVGQS